MDWKLALKEGRLEYERALSHNEHAEELSVLLLGFTGVIFAGILTFAVTQTSATANLFQGQTIRESLVALGTSAGLSAFPLFSTGESPPRASSELESRPGLSSNQARRVTFSSYELARITARFGWQWDDAFLNLAIVALGAGVALAVLSIIDPPPAMIHGVPVWIVTGVAILVAASFFAYLILAALRRERRTLARELERLLIARLVLFLELAQERAAEVSDD